MIAIVSRSVLAIAVFVAAAAFSSEGRAQGYMGIGIGVGITDVPSVLPVVEDYILTTYGDTCATLGVNCSSSVEDKAFAGKLFGGYRFTPNFAVEGFFIKTSAFESSASDGLTVTADVEVEAFAVGAVAVGYIPLSPAFELFGKAGGFYSKSEATATFTDTFVPVTSTATASDSGTDFILGAGGQVALTETVTLRGEYEYYNGEEGLHYLGLSMLVGF